MCAKLIIFLLLNIFIDEFSIFSVHIGGYVHQNYFCIVFKTSKNSQQWKRLSYTSKHFNYT